jgi:hypothetical protein
MYSNKDYVEGRLNAFFTFFVVGKVRYFLAFVAARIIPIKGDETRELSQR